MTSTPPPPESWPAYLFYEAVYQVSFWSLTLLNSLRMEGVRNVPRRGPVLFVANHQSYLDPCLVGLAVRRHLHYVARKSLFRNPAFAWLIRMLNAVPIDQDGIGIDGLRKTLQLLQEGHALVIYPEGGRTVDGRLQPLQPGVQLLIRKVRCPIVPVGIAGAYQAWPLHRLAPVPAPLFLAPAPETIAVSVGRPLDASRLALLPRDKLLLELFDEIRLVQERAERLRRKG